MKLRAILFRAVIGWAGLASGIAVEPTIAVRKGSAAPCTHLVFVIDTSGAMRDAKSGRLSPAIFQAVMGTMASHPEVREIQLFDAEGRRMLGAKDEWQPGGFDILLGIERVLSRYTPSTVPNPVPGIMHALRQLPAPTGPDAKVQIYVIGDVLVSQSESVLCRLDDLNPADVNGKRRAVISAVQVAAGITKGGENTKFRDLMSEVARQHGGTFRQSGGQAL